MKARKAKVLKGSFKGQICDVVETLEGNRGTIYVLSVYCEILDDYKPADFSEREINLLG